MRDIISDPKIQASRPVDHSVPFKTPFEMALALMTICENNGVAAVPLMNGRRVPFEASVIVLSDDADAEALADLRDANPTWTILTKPTKVDDIVPALISAVRHNRHGAIVVTENLQRWIDIAGPDLVYVTADDPIGFFGRIGGAE